MTDKELDECNTIRECLYWAEGEWPGFWDFATLQPLTMDEITDICREVVDNPMFTEFLHKIQAVAKYDRTEDSIKLLRKGSKAFKTAQRRANEYKKFTR